MASQENEVDLAVVGESVDDEAPYVAFDIASYPSDLTLSVINEMFDAGDVVIPDYQRNYVWDIKQASLLVESFLLGLPVPQVFFYVNAENKNEVIDGQQRILSIKFYLDGHFGFENIQGKTQVFRLQGLNDKSPYAKKRFVDLTEADQRKLRSAVLRAINIRQLNPAGEASSVYHIFERLNTGGTPLKPQEIRNCVFRGGLVAVLQRLNEDEAWRKIVGRKALDRHQKDVEMILRVFALTSSFESYEKPMKEFLNKTMARERAGTSEAVRTFEAAFPSTAARIVEELGDRPFHVRGPLNSSVLDTVFATLMSVKRKWPVDLANRYQRLLEDEDFEQTTYLSTSDKAVLRRRFDLARKALLG